MVLVFFRVTRADGGLAPTTEGNDDGIVGGPRTPQQIAAQRRLQQTQAQVDEVITFYLGSKPCDSLIDSFVFISALFIAGMKLRLMMMMMWFAGAKVVDIMKTNVEKVLERDQKLSELDDRADALQQGASQFEQQAGKLKRKFWLQNLKMMIIMGVIGLVIVAIIACK